MYSTLYENAARKNSVIEGQLTQRAAINLVLKFVDEIKLKAHLHLRHVILFGSYAQNEQHPHSDIDVALVADEFEGLRIIDNQFIMDLLIKSEYALIDTHTFNSADFENGSNPFMEQEIKPKGIVIL